MPIRRPFGSGSHCELVAIVQGHQKMAPRKTKPDPEYVCRFRGGPWAGKERHSISAMPSIEAPADEDNPTPGHYVVGEKLGELPGRNAIAYAYEWVADEEEAGGDSPAEDESD